MNVEECLLMDTLPEAVKFATEAHDRQHRKGSMKIPYITHPMEVMKLVSYITMDAEVLIAAVLHDVIEDCDITAETIAERFGQRVADIVVDCTRPGGDNVTRDQKFEWLESFETRRDEALIIKIADRLANTRDYKADLMRDDEYFGFYSMQATPLYVFYMQRHQRDMFKFKHNTHKTIDYIGELLEYRRSVYSDYAINITQAKVLNHKGYKK